MAPRNAPKRGSTPTRSTPGATGRGGRRAGTVRLDIPVGLPSNADHVKAIGVKRREFGTAGRKISIIVNAYNMTLPESNIYHYDVIITPKGNPDRTGPKFNFQLVKELQSTVRPGIFTPEGSYDGRKNMFTSHKLDLGEDNSKEFDIPIAQGEGRPPRTFKIRLTLANTINPETLQEYVAGKLSYNEDVSTALNALHVAVRMDAIMRMPYYGRSFFTDEDKKPLNGRGLELWRGYFQSIRPSIGRMIINVDIATGAMYKQGPLISLCLEFVNHTNPAALAPSRGFSDDRRRKLQQFLKGLRICTDYSGVKQEYPILKLSNVGARDLKFKKHDDSEISIANYFRVDLHRPLQHADVICVQVSRNAWLPLEVCKVPAGQVYKNDFPDDKDFRTEVVKFSTMKPADRFASIERGLTVLAHGQSQYIRDLGFSVDTSAPITVDSARVISGPKLKYGASSKQKDFTMINGVWNMVDKKFFKPGGPIKKWVIVIFVEQSRFNMQNARNVVKEFINACSLYGITVEDKDPIIRWEAPDSNIGTVGDKLLRAGVECKNQKGAPPDFMVVILPDAADPIYKEVKYFGDIRMGIATQCMLGSKCSRAKDQYWANIMLKVNPKLGGVNAIPDPSSVGTLADTKMPTMIIGADAMHPPPHSTDRPSYTSVVGSVDVNTSHYVACSRVQASGKRRDIIVDLKEMCKYVMEKHIAYQTIKEKKADGRPKRIIFYRDGVSEGEFQQVIDDELPLIRAACDELNIQATITLLVSVKRHHFRFKPQLARDGDKIGNCLAGTVVDKGLGSPLEYDFFLLSHAAIQGTSRPTYYAILHDEYNFKPDAIQAITCTLCHVYARSTRSVSIPAPVYYADIVCARAKNHYEPTFNISDTATNTTDVSRILEQFKENFKPLHPSHAGRMYFM